MPTAVSSVQRPLAPPEERFWQRYSPHHELPLSSAVSIALHVLALVILSLVGWWVAQLATQQSAPLNELPVAFEPAGSNQQPGMGANQVGAGDQLIEDIGPKQEKTEPTVDARHTGLKQPGISVTPIPATNDQGSIRDVVEEAEVTRHITAANVKKLEEGLKRASEGPGPGKDKGPPGVGTPTERDKRRSRWVMVFDTYSGDDYARQLAGLGAFLAIPHADGNAVSYDLIRDLQTRPVKLEPVDLAEIGRIHWEDDKRDSITPLCRALGIQPVPGHILAFFPEGLERKLLRLELDYRGRREEQIKETRFKVRKTGSGYEPVVISQTLN
jgi:hypothetical protein